jgi:TPP-dependent trihydroxycyclohexane-1,2-dione (THcHDO) dehydratase
MPYIASYVDDGKGVHKIGSGIVTGPEMFAAAMTDRSDEARARKLRYGLCDFSETTDMQVTPAQIRQLVEINRKMAELTPGGIVAIVAPGSLPYALVRLWHTLTDDLDWTRNVFHTRADAIAWLRKQLLAQDDSDPELSQYPSLKQD